jgi:hypothetical protein
MFIKDTHIYLERYGEDDAKLQVLYIPDNNVRPAPSTAGNSTANKMLVKVRSVACPMA